MTRYSIKIEALTEAEMARISSNFEESLENFCNTAQTLHSYECGIYPRLRSNVM
jgi:hypothetical protein